MTSFGYLVFGALLLPTRVHYTARAVSVALHHYKTELVAAHSTSIIVSMFAGLTGAVLATALNLFDVSLVFVCAAILHLVSSRLYWLVRTNLGGGSDVHHSQDSRSIKRQLCNAKVRLAILSSGFGKFFVGTTFAAVALIVDAGFNL